LGKILLEFNSILFDEPFLFNFSNLPFYYRLYFYIFINENNSLRKPDIITNENTLRKRKNRNRNLFFRGFIREVIKEVNFKLIISYFIKVINNISDFNGFVKE